MKEEELNEKLEKIQKIKAETNTLELKSAEKACSQKEICEYLGLTSVTYAIQTYVMPLVESGKMKMTNPEKPKSSKQLFYSE